ncbi:MAG: extracellular solute-binding protein, partial [Defluviitaleaceae bacterium]|nr:extracellular solute-binding protein [Defluviitaleaceae bacterium]
MKKKITASIIIFLAVLLVGCAGNKKEPLVVWCSQFDYEMISVMVESFKNAKKTDIKIIVEICEDSETREQIEGGNFADVICIPHDQLGALADHGYLHPIANEKFFTEINKNTAPSVAAGRFGGVQYGFPSSFETHMLFYDKSIV